MKRFFNFCFMLLWLNKQTIWVQVPCHGDISRFGCAYGFYSIWWLDLLIEFGHLDFVATENTTSPLKGILFGPIFGENQVGECSKFTQLCGVFMIRSPRSEIETLEPVQVVKSKASRLQQTMYRGRCCSVGGASVVTQECQLPTDLKRQMSRSTRWWPSTWCSIICMASCQRPWLSTAVANDGTF